jgi:hypothetical protein
MSRVVKFQGAEVSLPWDSQQLILVYFVGGEAQPEEDGYFALLLDPTLWQYDIQNKLSQAFPNGNDHRLHSCKTPHEMISALSEVTKLRLRLNASKRQDFFGCSDAFSRR